jgi:hypothetical protein
VSCGGFRNLERPSFDFDHFATTAVIKHFGVGNPVRAHAILTSGALPSKDFQLVFSATGAESLRRARRMAANGIFAVEESDDKCESLVLSRKSDRER